MFTALLDTCVLWPSLQRDFLLSLAVEGMYRPVWSTAILEELEYEEEQKLVARGEDTTRAAHRARRLVTVMRQAFDDAEIDGWQGLAGTYGLPDPDDEHVIAAAVVGGAGAIVTHNTKDFPPHLLPDGIDVLAPKRFAADTVALNPAQALTAVRAIAARSGRTGRPREIPEILNRLEVLYEMTEAAALLRPLI
ncbi:PIN domain-containing protein [Allokutzneria sp. NRRL B-24872]|uniref:PIN domain-containing protein n=1 Tax=Allokutzneria sp. NRRL B-24872 TaxID=1137961 RepID=UPI000A38B3CF|nr:PIN domain-containing protein [Allokutzneria sp. NRRL B-24872]